MFQKFCSVFPTSSLTQELSNRIFFHFQVEKFLLLFLVSFLISSFLVLCSETVTNIYFDEAYLWFLYALKYNIFFRNINKYFKSRWFI